MAIEEAVRRAGLEPQEAIMGNVLSAGLGQNPARGAALGAGLPVATPAFTVNKVCGSALKAVMLAAQAIKAGDSDVIVAGGMESMSNAPHLLLGSRRLRMGEARMVDHMIYDGLWDHHDNQHMGQTGEIVAERFGITREMADAFAARSHERAAKARDSGLFDREIHPVDTHNGPVAVDEGIRPGGDLSKLKPVFRADGIVTAGNASQLSDGASAVVVASKEYAEAQGADVLATIRGYGASGTKPAFVMEAPIASVQDLLRRANLDVEDIDLWEHNEAFSTASCAVAKGVGIPEDRLNIRGGAVALGHPIGASGARVLTTLIHALQDQKGGRGVATLCLGGGNAVSMLVEV